MISGSERREEILKILNETDKPVSATALANRFDVSRQIVVGDIALIRAQGVGVIATPRGYILDKPETGLYTHEIVCIHDYENMIVELNTIVDMGCKVLDVIVEHPVYGQISGHLELSSRLDVEQFIERVKTEKAHSLSELTDGVHSHTIECPDSETFALLEAKLKSLGIIYE